MKKGLGTWLAVAMLMVAAACGGSKPPEPAATQAQVAAADSKKKQPGLDTEPAARPKVVILGDSITAGLGVLQVDAYPALVQADIDAEGYNIEVVNAGESGDTSATALRRLDGLLDPNVKILILAVGGNDALRGIPPSSTYENVLAAVKKAQAKGVDVLVAGMQAPPNLGEDYTVAFQRVFPKVTRETSAVLLPFLLEGVAGHPELNQDDGIHPTPEGHKRIAALVYEKLKPMLDDLVNR